MRADWRRWVLYVERMLMVVAIVALGWYVTARGTAFFYQRQQSRQLDRLRDASRGEANKGTDVHLPAASAPPRAPRVHRSLIGRIEVPRIGLSAVVREGVDDRTLDLAVGHVPETPLPGEGGNVALAGHRDTFFRPLEQVRAGDRIRVTTPERELEYVVRDTRVVLPSDVSVLEPTAESMLTLVTCYPFHFVGSAPNRFIVRAEQVGPAAATAGVMPADMTRPTLLPVSSPPVSVQAAAAPIAAPSVSQPVQRPPDSRKRAAADSGQRPPRKAVVRKAAPKPKPKEDPKKKKRGGWRFIFKLR